MCVCVHTRAVRRGLQSPNDFFASAFCMLYYYSIFRIYLSREFSDFRIRLKTLSFCPEFGDFAQPYKLNANVQLTDVPLLLGLRHNPLEIQRRAR